MKKLYYRYEMELLFNAPVTNHHYRFQCIPAQDAAQRIQTLSCRVEPSGSVWFVTDGFGNTACAGEILESHDFLRVNCEGAVLTDIGSSRDEELQYLFLCPTVLTQPESNVREFYGEILKKYGWESDGREEKRISAETLMEELGRRMIYTPGVTGVKTTAAQALALGRGVCQDYAHLLISLCRLAGIPARYAAGAMIGEGATHAWVQVWEKGRWKGLDPANQCAAGEDYIRFASGRDFADCTVDKGCFFGAAQQQQKIMVKVEEYT